MGFEFWLSAVPVLAELKTVVVPADVCCVTLKRMYLPASAEVETYVEFVAPEISDQFEPSGELCH